MAPFTATGSHARVANMTEENRPLVKPETSATGCAVRLAGLVML